MLHRDELQPAAAGSALNIEINQASMVIDAAVHGQGITLARTALASWV